MELTASKVNDIFADCVFKTRPELGTKYIHVKGIVSEMGFVPKKINDYSLTIKMMLNELDDNFKEDIGGGRPVTQMSVNRSNEKWADNQTMEQLLMLGLASGWLKFLFPKKLRNTNGVPYVAFVKDRINVKEETYAV